MTYINIYSLYINTSEVPDWHCAGAEQGTDNSGTEIHFRFPAGARPAGAVSGEGPGGKGICPDAKYLHGKSSTTYIDKGRFVRENDSITSLIHLSQMYQKQYLRKQDTDLSVCHEAHIYI